VTPEVALILDVGRRRLGVVFGGLAIRRQGIYFAMITLALRRWCTSSPAGAVHGGEDGLQACPRRGCSDCWICARHDDVLRSLPPFFVADPHHLSHQSMSPSDSAQAIRENEPRALSHGLRLDRYKLVAFCLSPARRPGRRDQDLVLGFATLTDVPLGTSERWC